MMYMPDAISAIMTLMEADPAKLKHRNAFNVTAMSVDPEGLRPASAAIYRISASTITWILSVKRLRTNGRILSMQLRHAKNGDLMYNMI